MDPVTIVIIAGAVASVTTTAAAAWFIRKRGASSDEQAPKADSEPPKSKAPAASNTPSPGADDDFGGLSITIGDVVQRDQIARWPQTGVLIESAGEVVAGLLLASERGQTHAIVVFPAPQRDIYWLEQIELELPPTPPGRIEVGHAILDRTKLIVCTFAPRPGAPQLTDGTLALYEGALGDAAAIVCSGATTLAYHGALLTPDDYDVLGDVSPDHMHS